MNYKANGVFFVPVLGVEDGKGQTEAEGGECLNEEEQRDGKEEDYRPETRC